MKQRVRSENISIFGMTLEDDGLIFQIDQHFTVRVHNTTIFCSWCAEKIWKSDTITCQHGNQERRNRHLWHFGLSFEESSSLKAFTWTSYAIQSARIQTLIGYVLLFHCSPINDFAILITSYPFPIHFFDLPFLI